MNGANIVKADDTIGNLTVHRVDQVMFPPWSAPAKVLTPQQVLAFEGWAPEVINGRLAMLGFLTAVALSGRPRAATVAWDSGGGSFQFSADGGADAAGAPLRTYVGALGASVATAQMVEAVQASADK